MSNQEKYDESRLELLRAHICGGFYNRRDIVEATASAVIRSQALHILLDRYELNNYMNKPIINLRKDPKLDEIRRKIDDGYYDDPNHLAELVERLIKKLELEQNPRLSSLNIFVIIDLSVTYKCII